VFLLIELHFEGNILVWSAGRSGCGGSLCGRDYDVFCTCKARVMPNLIMYEYKVTFRDGSLKSFQPHVCQFLSAGRSDMVSV
jgi:hypothetical protein